MRKADLIIGAVIALLVLFGGVHFIKQYKEIDNNQKPDRPSVNETLNQTGAGETATLDEEDEYDEDEYGEDGDTSLYEPDEPTVDDLVDLNATRGETGDGANANGGSSSGNSGSTPATYDNADADGKFLVVAGTFKQEINAEIQLKKFKKMGYNDAEIGKFNKSAYASLIVDRFTTSASANSLVKKLKSKGIDAYVHKKR